MGAHRAVTLLFLAVAVVSAGAFADDQREALPLVPSPAKRIVVRGFVNESHAADILIDTGCSTSMISNQLAGKLKLRTLVRGVPVRAHGKVVLSDVVYVPSIRFGPVSRPVTCLTVDLQEYDCIIGMDVLRDLAFTVDFSRKSLQFGQREPLQHSVTIEPFERQVGVVMLAGNRQLRMILDTGADRLFLYAERAGSWAVPGAFTLPQRVGCVGHSRRAREVWLKDVRLGGARIPGMLAAVMEKPDDQRDYRLPPYDGVISHSSLGARRAHFDFLRGSFSWER